MLITSFRSLSDCSINQYRLLSQIGSGGFGLVFRAVNTVTQENCAVKAILKQQHQPRLPTKDFLAVCFAESSTLSLAPLDLNQIASLTELQLEKCAPHYTELSHHLKVHHHPNIVSIHDVLESPLATFIVMDYLPLDMFTAIIDHQYFANDGLLIKKVFNQICSAVHYCHQNGVYHCDIKPENILLDSPNKNAYLCDFGLASMDPTVTANISVGSSFYMAPEIVSSTITYRSSFPTYLAETWSLGIILINLTCMQNPWVKAHKSQDSVFNQYIANPEVLKEILPISDELYHTLVSVLQIDPFKRISILALQERVSLMRSFTVDGPLASLPTYEDQYIIPDDSDYEGDGIMTPMPVGVSSTETTPIDEQDIDNYFALRTQGRITSSKSDAINNFSPSARTHFTN